MKTPSATVTAVSAPTTSAKGDPAHQNSALPPDPRALAGTMRAVYGRCEVNARAVAAARRHTLGRTLAELEHARALGLVESGHPGFYRCSDLAEQVPRPEPALLQTARGRGGRFLLACSLAVAKALPGALLPAARIKELPKPDPTIVDAHSAVAWAQVHQGAVLLVAAEAARTAVRDQWFGVLAVDLALAGIAGAVATGDAMAWEALAKTAYAASIAISDRRGEGHAREHLAKSRSRQGLFDKALRTQRDALALREKLRDVRGIIASTNANGLTHWSAGDLLTARTCFEEAVKLADACNDRDFAAFARQNLAGVLLDDDRSSTDERAAALVMLDHAAARHAKTGALQPLANSSTLHAAGLRRGASASGLDVAITAARAGVQQVDASGEIGLAGHQYAELARCLVAAGRELEAAAWAATGAALFAAAGNHELEQAISAEFAAPRTDPADATEAEDIQR
jgi:tetratricopeptide (TPR) repeat protein